MTYARYLQFRADNARFGTISGRRRDGCVTAADVAIGPVLFGGYLDLEPGRYKIVLRLKRSEAIRATGSIAVRPAGGPFLAAKAFRPGWLTRWNPVIALDFELEAATERLELVVDADPGSRMTVASIELLKSAPPRPRRRPEASASGGVRRPLHILYVPCHEVLEYDEMRMLTDLGHRVFSLGIFSNPAQTENLRQVLPQVFDRDDWAAYQGMGLSGPFLDRFDVAIVMHEIKAIDDLLQRRIDLPIVYRSIGQSNRASEYALQPYAAKIHVVRYSECERDLDGFVRADDVIYFGKYAADYGEPWVGGGPPVTFHHSFKQRSSYPAFPDYEGLHARWRSDLYGAGNDGIEWAKGVVTEQEQRAIFRRAALYLYVYTVPPSYTLSFMEAMAAGVPIVAPTVAFVVRNALPREVDDAVFPDGRYEIEALLDHDERLLYTSMDEAHAKIAWLLANPAYCRMVSDRLRAKFAAVFGAQTISEQWNRVLYRVV